MNLPDSRGWVAIGLFLLFLTVFMTRALIPELLKDQTTSNILTALATSGVLAVGGFYFGSSKQDKPPE